MKAAGSRHIGLFWCREFQLQLQQAVSCLITHRFLCSFSRLTALNERSGFRCLFKTSQFTYFLSSKRFKRQRRRSRSGLKSGSNGERWNWLKTTRSFYLWTGIKLSSTGSSQSRYVFTLGVCNRQQCHFNRHVMCHDMTKLHLKNASF